MKIQTYLPLAAFLAICLFSYCKNDPAAAKNDPAVSQSAPSENAAPVADVPGAKPAQDAPGSGNPVVVSPGGTTATPAITSPEPPQNAAGVWHYTCPKGCAIGGGAATACATCGTTLAHNASYHGKPNPAATATQAPTQMPTQMPTQTPSQTPGQTPPTAKPEPPQNAAGVWHYTCPAGCASGGGAAVACASCGKKLEHNKAYHGQ